MPLWFGSHIVMLHKILSLMTKNKVLSVSVCWSWGQFFKLISVAQWYYRIVWIQTVDSKKKKKKKEKKKEGGVFLISNVLTSFCMPVVWPWPILKVTVQKKRSYIYQLQFLFGCKTAFLYLYFVCHHLCNYRHHYFDHFTDCQACLEGWMWTHLLLDSPSSGALEWTSIWYVTLLQGGIGMNFYLVRYLATGGHWNELLFGTLPCYRGALEWTSIWYVTLLQGGIGMNFYLVCYLATGGHWNELLFGTLPCYRGALEWTSIWYVTLLQLSTTVVQYLGHWNELLFGTSPCYSSPPQWCSIWGIGMNFYLVRRLATAPHHSGAVSGALEWTSIWYVALLQLPTTVVQYLGHWNELLFGTSPCYSSPPQWCSIWGIGMNFCLVRRLATAPHHSGAVSGALEWTSVWYVALLQLPTTVVQYLGHWNELLFGTSPCYSSPPQWCSIWGIGMNFCLVRRLATAPHHSGAVSGALEWTSVWYVALLQLPTTVVQYLGHWNELLFGTSPCYSSPPQWCSIWGIGMNFCLVRRLATAPHHSGAVSGALEWTSVWYVALLQLPTTVVQYLGHWNELLFGTSPCYSSPPQWCSIWGIGMNFCLVRRLATAPHHSGAVSGALEWTSVWYVALLQLPTTVVQYLGHWNELLFGTSPCYSSPPQWCSIWGIGMNFCLVRRLATAPHHSGAVSGALEWTSVWYVALLQLPTTVVQYLGHWNELLFGTSPCYSSPPQWCSIWGIGMNFCLVRRLATAPHHSGAVSGALEWTSVWYVALLQLPTTVVQYLGHWNELLFGTSPCYSSPPQWCSIWGIGMNFCLVRRLATAPHHSGAVSGALEWTSVWYVALLQLPTTVVQYLGHWNELLFGTSPCYSSPPQWCSIWGIGMNFCLVRRLATAPHHSGAVSGALEWTSVWYVALLQLPTTVVQYLGHWNELLFGTSPCYSSPPQWCSIWGIGMNFCLVRRLATAPHHSGAVSGALEWTSVWYVALLQLPTTVVQYLGHWNELLFGTSPCYSSPPQWCSIWGIGMNFCLVRRLATAPHHSGAVSGALEWTSVWYVALLQLPTTVVQYLGHWNELLFGTSPCYSSPPQWCSIWGIGMNFCLVRRLATAPHHSGAVSGALEWTSVWYVALLQLPTTVVQYLGHWNELLFGTSPCYSSPPQWCSIWGIGMNFCLVRRLATAPHHSGAVSGALEWTSVWYVALLQLPTTVVQYLGHWNELLFGTSPCYSSPPQWCSIWGIGMNFCLVRRLATAPHHSGAVSGALEWTSVWYVALLQLPTTVVQYLGHWNELLFGTSPCHSSPPQWCSIWGIGMNFCLVRRLATAPHHSGAVSGALEWTSVWYVALPQLPTTVVQYLGHWNELLFGTSPCHSSPPQWCSIWGIGMNFCLVRRLATAPHHSGAVSGALEWTSVWYVALPQLPTTVVQYLGHWNELLFGTSPCHSSPPQWCSIWGIGMNFCLVRRLATAPHHSGAVSGALEWTSVWYVALPQLPTTVVQYLGHWNELLFGTSPCHSSPPQWCSIWGIGMNFCLVRRLATAPHHSGAVSGALEWTSVWYVALPQLPTTVVQYLGHWNELLFGTSPCHSSPPQWCSIWGIGMNFCLVRHLATAPHHSGAVSGALEWTSVWYVTLPQLPTTVVQYLGHWNELLFGTSPCHSSPPQWCSIWGIGMNFCLVRHLATAPHHSGAVSGALEWTSVWYVTLPQLPTTVVQYLGHWNELLFGTSPCHSSPPQWCSIWGIGMNFCLVRHLATAPHHSGAVSGALEWTSVWYVTLPQLPTTVVQYLGHWNELLFGTSPCHSSPPQWCSIWGIGMNFYLVRHLATAPCHSGGLSGIHLVVHTEQYTFCEPCGTSFHADMDWIAW